MPGWTTFDAFLADVTQAADDAARRRLVDALLKERPSFPWIEGTVVTFVYRGSADSVALNLDTIPSDPPFMPMERLAGTDLWTLRYPFESDDLLDYLIAVDDPGTPLAHESDIAGRVSKHWRPDPLNPLYVEAGETRVSVLRMPGARPFIDWTTLKAVQRGAISEHRLTSSNIAFADRKVWMYAPPGFDPTAPLPLLILQDGQWAVGPLQVPAIADALIKHRRMKPTLIVMIQSATNSTEREREYIQADRYYNFLISELLPFVQTQYNVDMTQVGIGGVAVGAVAAAAAALSNPVVFSRLLLISPPLGGKGSYQEVLRGIVRNFTGAAKLPSRVFQSVGRYETRARFIKPAQSIRSILEDTGGVAYRYVEVGSGHGLVGFRGILPEALTWGFPGGA
ncbi:MAG: alpha/beta hydrolase-fold protein [Chloroflexota bacterium]|nr:alpha/beta hydrolase-fold protein [Chloroflexota bacterium]